MHYLPFGLFFSFVRQRKREGEGGRERLRDSTRTVFIDLFLDLLPTYLKVTSYISLERKRIFEFVVIVLFAQDFGRGVKKQSVDAVR